MQEGVTITFGAITGHTLTDQWVSTVTVTNPFNVQNAAGTSGLLTVLNSGNVGIGTTSPQSILDVVGANGSEMRVIDYSANSIGINFSHSNVGTDYSFLGYLGETYFNRPSGKNIHFREANSASDQMTILSGGNVGIGTTAPGSLLDIEGTNNANPLEVLRLDNLGTAGGTGPSIGFYYKGQSPNGRIRTYATNTGTGDLYFRSSLNSSYVTNMVLQSSGNVGIGTTSPSQKLEVNGKVQIDDLTTAGGASAVYSIGGVLTTAVSSGRFKENVTPYEDVLSRVDQLSAVHFTWKPGTATPGQADFGFIAEDAANLFPELSQPTKPTVPPSAV